MANYSSTSSTRAVRSLFTGVVPGVDAAGSADVVVAEGVVSWAVPVAGVGSDLAFLLFFFCFLLCVSWVSNVDNDNDGGKVNIPPAIPTKA